MRDKKVVWQNCVDNESQKQAKKQLRVNRNRFKQPRKTVQIRIQKKWHLLILKEAKEAEVTLSKYLDYVCQAYFSKSNEK